MATLRGGKPYLWVTWVTGLLSGENHCEFASWFRAHYRDFEKAPRNVDLTIWTAEHGEMVRRRAQELKDDGYTVFVEDQNGFSLKGAAAVLGGKADIVAISPSGNDAIVVDCKSGKPRDKDVFQVLIYMLVLPLAVSHCKCVTMHGELEYPGKRVEIGPEKLTADVKALIRSTIERLAQDVKPHPIPSAYECRFCDLTKADCPARVEAEPVQEAVTHNLW